MSRGQRGIAWFHFFLVWSVKDWHCNGREASHRSIVPSTYLGMGAWKTCCSFVMDPSLSEPTVRVFFVEEVLAPHWLQDSGAGAWSPSLDGDLGPPDKRVMGWSCLCLGYKRGVCFWGTQLEALIRESPGNPVRLVYGLAS